MNYEFHALNSLKLWNAHLLVDQKSAEFDFYDKEIYSIRNY